MNIIKLARQLTEYQAKDAEALELDRLLLRLFEMPALMSYLVNVGRNGANTELDFLDLPLEAIEAVKRAIGPVDIEVLTYDVNGWPHTGFRFNLAPLAELSTQEPDAEALSPTQPHSA